jgi:hypothetical protein
MSFDPRRNKLVDGCHGESATDGNASTTTRMLLVGIVGGGGKCGAPAGRVRLGKKTWGPI